MWDGAVIRRVNLNRQGEVAAVRSFLDRFTLGFDESVDYTLALFKDETMVATGSLAGEVLRNFAVDETHRGEGLSATMLSELMREAAARGTYHYFIFTRPEKSDLFASMGFTEIARAEPHAAVLESGIGSIKQYCEDLARQTEFLPQQNRAAIVMNCNPFTLGHLALIKRAASTHNVVLFVVSEDKSLFPFADRFRLIREGVSGLSNVAVVPGGKYIISAATFPGYFTRESETIVAQTRLDITLFAARIAPPLRIKARYVGEEPYCEITSAYNQAMADILPANDIEFIIIPRADVDGEIISASKVREAIRTGDWKTVGAMVPETTFDYLMSDQAHTVIDRIRQCKSRH
jgi:[citrate (pro-3S)-lyase] ligase